MSDWTPADPAAGDMQTLIDYAVTLDKFAERGSDTIATVDSARSQLADSWSGYAAGASDTELAGISENHAHLVNAPLKVAKALRAYVDFVNAIVDSAAAYIADRADAHLRAAVRYLDDPANPPSDLEYADRSSKWKQATKDFGVARDALAQLGVLRDEAESAFVVAVGQSVSLHLSDGYSTTGVSWEQRLAANDEVWMLFAEFQDGAGTHRLLLDGDPFVEMLQQSSHVNMIRDQTLEMVNAGSLHQGDYASADRSLVDQYVTGAFDLANIGTGGLAGNLPESFLGSFSMKVTVDAVDEDGNATVTYTVQNTTSIESFVRNPFDQTTQLPGYSELQQEQEEGKYLNTQQTIVWTELVVKSSG